MNTQKPAQTTRPGSTGSPCLRRLRLAPWQPLLVAQLGLMLGGAVHAQAQAAPATPAPAATSEQTNKAAVAAVDSNGDPVTTMSPFEVISDDHGYYGANTMSGTRLNSKIQDLASSITVITKEQMSDFALLDINDIFSYEAGTEGSGNYTDFVFNASSQPQDNLSLSPNTANRIRGLNSANVSLGAFETSNRVPVDPSMVDSIEITRGPNSNIFGLGNASGTVNMVPSSANLSRNTSEVRARYDSFGGWRESLDVSRVLVPNQLAIRLSEVYQHTGYELKPSGTNTERYNGMVKYQPFKTTTITYSYSYYNLNGNRPNSVTPRDAVSPWVAAGSPTWDPTTNTAYVHGSPVSKAGVAVATLGGGIPTINGAAVFNSAFQTSGRGQSLMYVDPSGVTYWTAPRGTTTNNPIGGLTDQSGFNLVQLNPQTLRATQPLWSSDAAISDKSMYDWSSINAAAMNSARERDRTSLLNLNQIFFDTQRQMLAAQVSWFRELSPVWHEEMQTGGPSGSTYLYVDVNQKRLDGTPNPYYLRPYFGVAEGIIEDLPLRNDTYRAQLAYKLDLTHEKSWLRWLGLQQVAAYGEYKDFEKRQFLSEYAMLDNHSWLAAGTPRATSAALLGDTLPQDQAAPFGTRSFAFYYVGDNQGNNIDYAPGAIRAGNYPFTWGNFAAGKSTSEPTQLGLAASINGSAAANNNLKIQKTEGVVLQSHLIDDRFVSTVGVRKDKVYAKNGANAQLNADGFTQNFGAGEQWASGDYKANSGLTRTVGAVVRPLHWLSLYANKSDSFIPADPAINLHGQVLPNPQGKGEDWGFMLNLFNGKLNLRANQYTTRQANSRSGTSTTLALRAIKMDIYDGQPSRDFALDLRIPNQIGLAPALVQQLENAVTFNPGLIAESEDALSKGHEVELNYNPWNFWTLKANLTEERVIQQSIAKDLTDYLAERMPIWTSLKDPTSGQQWYNYSYDNGTVQTPNAYLLKNVTTPLGVALAKVGKTLPQIRRYRVNFETNFHLSGITDNRILKHINVGGAVRWEDKGAIGYYGLQKLPAVITDLDPNNPVYDKGHTYVDLLAGYRTRLFSNRVGTTFQINVRNVQENGRLQPISAYPDGTPNAYRIIDPRQFIFSVTFDL